MCLWPRAVSPCVSPCVAAARAARWEPRGLALQLLLPASMLPVGLGWRRTSAARGTGASRASVGCTSRPPSVLGSAVSWVSPRACGHVRARRTLPCLRARTPTGVSGGGAAPQEDSSRAALLLEHSALCQLYLQPPSTRRQVGLLPPAPHWDAASVPGVCWLCWLVAWLAGRLAGACIRCISPSRARPASRAVHRFPFHVPLVPHSAELARAARRFAFRMVLAGLRYQDAGHKLLAAHSYR